MVKNSADRDFGVKDETRDTCSCECLEAGEGRALSGLAGKGEEWDEIHLKKNEKGKDDIVFPHMKVPVYGRRGCYWTRQCEWVREDCMVSKTA